MLPPHQPRVFAWLAHWQLLKQYILQPTVEEVNLTEDSNAHFKAVQDNTHVVVLHLHTQSYHEKVLMPVFGV